MRIAIDSILSSDYPLAPKTLQTNSSTTRKTRPSTPVFSSALSSSSFRTLSTTSCNFSTANSTAKMRRTSYDEYICGHIIPPLDQLLRRRVLNGNGARRCDPLGAPRNRYQFKCTSCIAFDEELLSLAKIFDEELVVRHQYGGKWQKKFKAE
ncbi:MAG: hypothetical protein M1812_004089 [Candelaria pacifica]|nr:MAG: hypothetical protein M1812_004089 [Candelaria pacifica]